MNKLVLAFLGLVAVGGIAKACNNAGYFGGGYAVQTVVAAPSYAYPVQVAAVAADPCVAADMAVAPACQAPVSAYAAPVSAFQTVSSYGSYAAYAPVVTVVAPRLVAASGYSYSTFGAGFHRSGFRGGYGNVGVVGVNHRVRVARPRRQGGLIRGAVKAATHPFRTLFGHR